MQKDTYVTIKINAVELEKIIYLKDNTEATTKTGVFRKALYSLYDQVKQRESSRK